MNLNTDKIKDSNQEISERFNKEWYKNQSEKDRKLFESLSIALLAIVVLLIFTLTKESGDSGYLKAHSALFIASLMAFLVLIIRRKDLSEILTSCKRSLSQFDKIGLTEVTDLIFTIAILLSVVSILFVIDLSFFSNYGIRIGAVAAVGVVKVLKSVIFSFK